MMRLQLGMVDLSAEFLLQPNATPGGTMAYPLLTPGKKFNIQYHPQFAPDSGSVYCIASYPRSRYLSSGHCQIKGFLPVYTPGNGALLSAVAMV
jgi:hypothetical protein